MVCLRCGYCCYVCYVVIVNDPEKELSEDNVEYKNTDVRCKHLEGEKPREFSCKIHDKEWYEETPCFEHTQIEHSPKDNCRMGEYVLKDNNHLMFLSESS